MKKLLKKLRKAAKFSQADLAQEMGISRPTLISIEKGDRDLSLAEIKKLSEIFDIPLSILMDQDLELDEKVEARNYTANSAQKFHNLVLQCIKHGAAPDGKITKTKLAKLVYLCDFAHYYKYLKPISGFEYRRLDQGPVPIEFFDLIDNDESINIEAKGNAILVSLTEKPSSSSLSKTEEAIVHAVCEKWKDANTQEIVEFTHKQLPWATCKEHETIPYELINMEDPENVY